VTGSPVPDITALLTAWSAGDQAALDALVPAVYAELHRLAHARIRHESPGHLLQTTALVNEAFLRLTGAAPAAPGGVAWENRLHFFAVAAKVMRRVLVDAARQRGAAKRGGDLRHVPFEESLVASPQPDAAVLGLDEALQRLAQLDPRKERVVELRYFAGLSVEETAAVLQVSADTVTRDWKVAKLWLLRELDVRVGAGEPS
jgi:RNA polymerase sigma-70 factor (ECF subfamily)